MLRPLVLMSLLMATQVASWAQDAPPSPTPFSGTVVSYNDTSVTLKDKEGKTIVVQMTPGWTVSVLRTADANAIKVGSFVATNNARLDAKSGKATELRVLEPGYRPEEGTHGITGSPNLMTHGTVSKIANSAAGTEVDVTYPGGSHHVVVPQGVTVTVSDPLDRSALKPGVAVSSVTRKGADGVPRAGRVVVSK